MTTKTKLNKRRRRNLDRLLDEMEGRVYVVVQRRPTFKSAGKMEISKRMTFEEAKKVLGYQQFDFTIKSYIALASSPRIPVDRHPIFIR